MAHKKNAIGNSHSRIPSARLTGAVALAVVVLFFASAQGQTFRVIHNFTGGLDGSQPAAGLTMDAAGNLYGTASGFPTANGSVFQLARKNSGWIFNPLYNFAAGNDGARPLARVVFGPDGNLYGTTEAGGGTQCYIGGPYHGCGTVFSLTPRATPCVSVICPWTETVLYRFTGYGSHGDGDGAAPEAELTFDAAGAIYSVTPVGGLYGSCDAEGDHCGVAYELVRSGDSWQEGVLYDFGQANDGAAPHGGLLFDNAGNAFGVTPSGGNNYGILYELQPNGSNWIETILHRFNFRSDAYPYGGLIMDSSGAIYGATRGEGNGFGGTVFKATQSGGQWTLVTLYTFTGNGGPASSLLLDAAGNLYGTTYMDGAFNQGAVFKLTKSNNLWTYSSLHDFTGDADGGAPMSNVVFDTQGNLYGTTSVGGAFGQGVVWEITP